jgi:hypothetical protein
MYLVGAKARDLQVQGKALKVWILEAWGVPRSFYEEAWKAATEILGKGEGPLVGGLYGLSGFITPDHTMVVFFLLPAWEELFPDDKEHLGDRLSDAAAGLIRKASHP